MSVNFEEAQSTGERLLTGYFDRFTVEHLHRYAIAGSLASGKEVLDIACGEGYGSKLLSMSAASVVGVDIDEAVVQHAAEKYLKPGLKFLVGSANNIPVPDASIDLVVSFETLEHHSLHEEMYLEIKRVLRPDGLLVISTPNKKNFSDLTGHRNAYHVKELYLEEFRDLNERFFSKVNILDQRMIFGSLVFSAKLRENFSLYQGDHTQVDCLDAFSDPLYHICIASEAELPTLKPSIFDGSIVVTSLEQKHDACMKSNAMLADRLVGVNKQLSELQASWSYRMGRAILYPFRWLKSSK